MSEIMQCVFERREPVRNVTALALMQYVCEEFPRSRVDVVGMDNFMDKPSMAGVSRRMGSGRSSIRRRVVSCGGTWTTRWWRPC